MSITSMNTLIAAPRLVLDQITGHHNLVKLTHTINCLTGGFDDFDGVVCSPQMAWHYRVSVTGGQVLSACYSV